MAHSRTDSAMTHSTRKSYKEKLAKLQADKAFDVERATQVLETQAEANSSFLEFQEEYHSLCQRIAKTSMEAVQLLDDLSFCEGIKFPTVQKKLDTTLSNMNMSIMLRRSDDVLKKMMDRVGVLTEAYNDTRRGLDTLLTQTNLLKSPLEKIREKALETAVVGAAATDVEKQEASEAGEYNRFGITYETDTDDYDSDRESEDEDVSGAYALALRN